jgi:heme-degrading monooxygenase HmoA
MVMLVQHKVKDYAEWKKMFDSAIDMRKAHGEISVQVLRDANDPNDLTIVNYWDTMANAQEFANSSDLHTAMEKGGVIGMPIVHFLNEA